MILPGPPGLLPWRPDAVVDLRTHAGAALVRGAWRYRDADLVTVESPSAGPDLGASGPPVRTLDVAPHAEGADVDDAGWEVLDPPDVEARRGRGRVCFAWYRIAVTLPERVGAFPVAGSTVVFEVVVDDYAEVWVDGALPRALGQAGGGVVAGFNVPNRVVVARDARPGQRIQLAVFAMNGPVSASPGNFLWLRTATLDLYTAARARRARPVPAAPVRADGAVVPHGAVLEQVAGGFDGVTGLVAAPGGGLLLSSPGADAVLRWTPDGEVGVFRARSGSAGLAVDADGRLTICEPAAGRVVRIEPHGNLTVLAEGLDHPRHLAYAPDGALYVTAGGLHRVAPAGPPPPRPLATSWQPAGPAAPATLVAGAPPDPGGLAVDPPGGLLYLVDGPTVLRTRAPALAAGADQGGAVGEGPARADPVGAAGGLEPCWREDGPVGALLTGPGGSVLVGVPGGVRVRSADGADLAQVTTPEPPTALAWDGGGVLFIGTEAGLYRLGT